tara:strand:+ start:111457 stop:111561 length:105 start_codon:yes stop_codon:yes gene_type:complete
MIILGYKNIKTIDKDYGENRLIFLNFMVNLKEER